VRGLNPASGSGAAEEGGGAAASTGCLEPHRAQ
jgi:hypothetical protein